MDWYFDNGYIIDFDKEKYILIISRIRFHRYALEIHLLVL